VSERARDLFKGYLELHTALKGEGNAWPTVKEQQAVWSERQGGLDKARKRLIDAMRRDVFASGERRPSRAGTPRGELDSGS
jgi:hypothetical protein